jgi:hypothetical protein
MVSVEIDHVFVLCAPGAPEAERLAAVGLIEGSRNVHPGQGTANRRFFFRNTMIELLWVSDELEARASPLDLAQRWANRGTHSPFGILLRPKDAAPAQPPFEAWDYRPPGMPGFSAQIASGLSLDEPFWGFLPQGRRQDTTTSQLVDHPAGMRELTAVLLTAPRIDPAPVTTRLLNWTEGAAHCLDFTFDHGAQRRTADLRPELPLILRW